MKKLVKALKWVHTDFNDWFAERLAVGLSSMQCFYVVALMVLLPLIWQRPEGLVGWMQYAISVFFQGVALPVLGYVADKAAAKMQKIIEDVIAAAVLRIEAKVDEELALVKQQLDVANEDRKILLSLVDELHAKHIRGE
jgi:hypothetical protein